MHPSSPSIADRLIAAYRRVPAIRIHWRLHGFRATLIRGFDVLIRGPYQSGIDAASRWAPDGPLQTSHTLTTPEVLRKATVCVIAALDLPQCRKYRVIQKVEQLHDTYSVDVLVSSWQDTPRAFNALQLATCLIFYRIPDDVLFRGYLAEAKRLGLTVLYDIDDPIFSDKVMGSNQNLEHLQPRERKHLINASRDYLSAMRACDACIVSTPGMLEAVALHVDTPVYLWRNAVDSESREIVRQILADGTPPTPADIVTIGYMSGSRAHDSDFATISKPLSRVLRDHPNTQLLVAGHATLPEEFAGLEDRIIHHPPASYRFYFHWLTQVDLVVIPLETNAFNQCKSAIRLLEAAMLAKPCIASAVGDFVNVASHAETALLASDEQQWHDALEELVISPRLRERIGARGREVLVERHGTPAIAKALSPELLQYLTRADA